MRVTEGADEPQNFRLSLSPESLCIQDTGCSTKGNCPALPLGNLCSSCLASANLKALILCACRFGLLLGMIDMLDVLLNHPVDFRPFFADVARTAEYVALPALRADLYGLSDLSIAEFASELHKKLHRRGCRRRVAQIEGSESRGIAETKHRRTTSPQSCHKSFSRRACT